jgi:uncharacterized protein (DUF488 family)
MLEKVIYTVGHSTHPIAYFAELLETYHINCVVDVRSVAASRYNPQFNKEPLMNYLRKRGVMYLHFEREFGARQTDPSVFDDKNRVDFEKFRKTPAFTEGVIRLERGIEKNYRIALMCSEAEPLDCHRFSMISVGLIEEGFTVKHIMKDKSLMTNDELEAELLKKYAKKLPQPTIFEPNVTAELQLKTAYKFRNQRIGWTPNDDNEEDERL